MSCGVVSRMVMRARTQRNNAGKDTYGHKKQPTPAENEFINDAAPCLVWVKNRREVIEGKSTAVEEIRANFLKDADIMRGDTITEISNRRGETVFEGPLFVGMVNLIFMFGVPSHKDVELRRTRG